ncbi:hypothetical protein AVJ23_21630 [Pseudoponticoccus marisrubri]|uniref:Filamentous haemagglutinin FhaB/tRNA nuclease CdiA-like TPS domain-containing protein n=1 Tax=Pseudoponticoccus marisrubri TaxID=1685382 RepID=A0A0W7WDF7_9RHOB|nr:hypothetical protein AVJ23_21630 [Pseudoponticoccus marisrubri]
MRQSSDRAVINWGSFDIDEGETTRFIVPEASSVTLNRDISGDPSEIYGTLQSNGRLFLVNRSGILFGEGSRVDVASLVATTHDIRTEDFANGRLEFTIPGDPGASVINRGQVTVGNLGFGAFVAPHIRNDGAIVANLGRVEMASANGFTLDLHGDRLISFMVENPNDLGLVDSDGNPVGALVENSGTISANGGQVVLSAAAARGVINQVINTDGIIEANTVATRGGRIILGGGDAGVVQVAGKVAARGDDHGETGGTIAVMGEVLSATELAFMDASGSGGGGRLMFGGDYLGGRADDTRLAELGIERSEMDLEPSQVVALERDATLSADADDQGDGGVVIVWGDQGQFNHATLTATGGPNGGNGGFVETSAANLQFNGTVDVSASNGVGGTWLLDPLNITIDEMDEANANWFPFIDNWNLANGGSYEALSFAATDRGAIVPVDVIEDTLSRGNNVVITTLGTSGSQSGDIRLRTDVSVRNANGARLALLADDDIRIDRGVDVRARDGRLTFELAAFGGDIDADGIGRIDLDGGELILQFEDGLDISSRYDMPETVTLIALNESLGNRRSRVDFSFDDNFGHFDYTGNVVNLYPGSLDLRDRTSHGHVNLIFDHPVEARVWNLAVIWDDNHSWSADGFRVGGVEDFNALDGIPEYVGDTTVLGFGPNPGNGLVSVFEISDDLDQTVDRYIVTAPAGQAILDAHLAEVSRRTQTPVQEAVGQVEAVVDREPVGPTPARVEASFQQPERPPLFANPIVDRLLAMPAQNSPIELSDEERRAASELPLQTVSELPFSRETYDRVVVYAKSLDTIAGGMDELTEGSIAEISTVYGVSWAEVFGELLLLEEISVALSDGRYEDALVAAASRANSELVGLTALGGAAKSAAAIGRLASLPITSQVSRFVEMVAARGANQQREAYFFLRDQGFSHSQIINNDGVAQFLVSDGWIRRLYLTGRPDFAQNSTVQSPAGNISPEDFLNMMQLLYEATQNARELPMLRERVVDEFLNEQA